jgi:hypothetical protein
MLDAYNRKARVAPAVLAALPGVAFLIAAAVKPTAESSPGAVVLAALTLLICTLVRDRGRRIEPGLWRAWGGPPTSVRLRWGPPGTEAATRSLHQRVSATTDIDLPDADDQASMPDEAERLYEQAVLVLRERTRDPSAFPLVAAENAEYGFRRNLLGLRPLALAGAAITVTASGVMLAEGHLSFLVPAVASLVAGGVWFWLIGPSWVRLAAERYADRLLGASVTLPARPAA